MQMGICGDKSASEKSNNSKKLTATVVLERMGVGVVSAEAEHLVDHGADKGRLQGQGAVSETKRTPSASPLKQHTLRPPCFITAREEHLGAPRALEKCQPGINWTLREAILGNVCFTAVF